MPGNQELYEQQMNIGHESAWSRDWSGAANAYGRALQEFPEDVEAHLSLAFALLRAERLNEALKVYNRAHQLSPSDPIPIEKSADVLQKMGRLKEAAQRYANVGEAYLKQEDVVKAISSWEKATQLTPGLVALHNKLGNAYRHIGDKRRAVYHYLMLAFNFSRSGDSDRAVKAAQKALQVNRRSTEALNALRAAESGSEVSPPTPVKPDEAEEGSAAEEIDWDGFLSANGDTAELVAKPIEVDPLGPMGAAMGAALSMLADHIIAIGGFDEGSVSALQAMEFQRQGLHSEAISAYQKSNAHLQHPALSLNLGALLLLGEQATEATKSLAVALKEAQLKPGAMHALGQACYHQGKYKSGVENLSQAARTADLMFTNDPVDQEEIQTVYQSLGEAVAKRPENDEMLGVACRRFVSLLSGKEWDKRLRDTRYQMAEANRDGGGERILEFLVEDISEDVPESIAKIDQYIRRGLYTLATDEAQYAIEKAPSYLPIHVRMAEVMMLEGRLRQAISKYNTVAKTYRVRGETGRAASILVEVLDMAPLDVDVRRNLIDLLEEEDRLEEALDQYIELAGTYRQLGNLDSARTTYAEAERIAEQVNSTVEKRVLIKLQIADIDQLRMDLRRALRVYEEIVQLDPTDETARKALVDANLQLGNQIEGIKQLDELLRVYAKRKQVKSILTILQELVRLYPDDSGLRSRLAAIYRQLGRREEAVVQLDKLADLQLDAELTDDACDTIKQIVKMNPPGVEKYRELLKQLGCSN